MEGGMQHNLKEYHCRVSAKPLCVVSGVSGSGKTPLVKQVCSCPAKDKGRILLIK